QRIRFTPPPPRPVSDRLAKEAIPLDVLYEDRHLIVVNKPAGMVVHPAPGHETGTLVNALLHHCGVLPAPPAYTGALAAEEGPSADEGEEDISLSRGGGRRPGTLPGLDRAPGGVLVCPKAEPTLVGLRAQFRAPPTARRYLALVEGVVPERGTFDSRYGRHPH